MRHTFRQFLDNFICCGVRQEIAIKPQLPQTLVNGRRILIAPYPLVYSEIRGKLLNVDYECMSSILVFHEVFVSVNDPWWNGNPASENNGNVNKENAR